MKRWVAAISFAGVLGATALAAGKGPEIVVMDGQVSITADNIGLGRLLKLLDRATGMESTVPPELANRNLSVRFSGLTVDDAVRKIFQGQPYDYVVIGGQGIIVTAASQTAAGGAQAQGPAPAYNPPPDSDAQPFVQDIPQPFPGSQAPQLQPVQAGQAGQPAVIQTPFGPIANPRAGQAAPQLPNMPVAAGQAPAFFGGTPSPSGTAITTGTTGAAPSANDLFGRPLPVFGPGSQEQSGQQRKP